MKKGAKAAVGMSGGVDSSVAAYLLKEQGYDVFGVTMRVWGGEEACEDARRVCGEMGIAHYEIDLSREFKENVIDYFVGEYARGRTPNPCVECNRRIKWGALLSRALELGADFMATGHYARTCFDEGLGRWLLKRPRDSRKDQTYALYGLNQEQLSRALFPLGEYTKEEVRETAARAGLLTAQRPDSQDICFVPDGDYGGFVRKTLGGGARKGLFVDTSGRVLGEHEGIFNYTAGQRRGLNIAAGRRIYVKSIDAENNTVVLADDGELFGNELYAGELNFIYPEAFPEGAVIRLCAKIRYAHKAAACAVSVKGGVMKCVFDEPQRAATPGQSVVLYDGDLVCGGGIIL